jgi:pyrroline-5-carboxylate reductase
MSKPTTAFTRPDAPVSAAIPPVAIIGTGAMGEALMAGLVRSAGAPAAVHATSNSAATAKTVSQRLGHPVVAVANDADANRKAARVAQVTVLAVAPADIPGILEEITPVLPAGALVISLAAGVGLERIADNVPAGTTVVRAIPNLGGQVGFGVTGVGTHDAVSEEQMAVVNDVFSTIGTVVTVRDDQLDAVSSLSGTGPAYFYFYTQQMTQAAVELGFTEDQARKLAQGTFIGAAAVMHSTGESPDELLRFFTHPAGTSIHAIRELSGRNLNGALVDAANATVIRARELAGEADSAFVGR